MENSFTKIVCKKCKFEGEGHIVNQGLGRIVIGVIQCPKCCFNYDLFIFEVEIQKEQI